MNTTFKLFVYGSLRQGFGHPVFSYISQYFNFEGPAKVRGKLYNLGEYPAATPVEEPVYIVGELYSAKNNDEFSYAIAQLDDYEGINTGEDSTSLYRRQLAEIETASGNTTAWVYWYNGSVSGYPFIESGDILTFLQQQ